MMFNPPLYNNNQTANAGNRRRVPILVCRPEPLRYQPVPIPNKQSGFWNTFFDLDFVDVIAVMMITLVLMNFGKVSFFVLVVLFNACIFFVYFFVRPSLIMYDEYFGHELLKNMSAHLRMLLRDA
ncbi:transmembrane protein, putative, partial [Rhizoctonia solani AG-3 Rhs1AP]